MCFYNLIVKLHTTSSTNRYLKKWIASNTPENYMLVVADYQTMGRGQIGTKWFSKPGKNLTFSMFVRPGNLSADKQFQLNQAVSLGLLTAIKKYIPSAEIKWPNDILAGGKKIAGILIENTVSKNKIKHSIVGIGLNVNQTEFPEEIPNATSLKLLCNTEFDLNNLLKEIVNSIKTYIHLLDEQKQEFLEQKYLQNLYLFEQKANYLDYDNSLFKGSIIGVSSEGKLEIKLLNGTIKAYNFKEIVFL